MASYDQILSETDVVEFIRNQRYLKGLIKILLSDREKKLLFHSLRQIDIAEHVSLVYKQEDDENFIKPIFSQRSSIKRIKKSYF